jgi:predicted MPP superfamily phosphohydrolase
MPTLLGILVACALAAILWLRRHMLYTEPNHIAITYHEIPLPEEHSELDGVVICHLTDLHICEEERNQAAVSRAVRSVKADLYAFTGDLIGGTQGIEHFLSWLDAMGASVRPAVLVLGNAEHKKDVDTQKLLDALHSRGIVVLNNRTVQMQLRSGATLQILGVDDPHTGLADFAAAARSLDSKHFTLVLCHSPDGLADEAFPKADLVLCGHTHGGQIRLPFIPVWWTNTRRVRGFVSGMYCGASVRKWIGATSPEAKVYVSRGLGTGGCRARLLCPPELPVFTLRRK